MAWRDHFTQKLEDEPELEWRAYHPALDEFRGDGSALTDEQHTLLDEWVGARTGFPMVDAVVNQLRQTGWTTFRMRAMLVSFASYDLWLPWQVTGVALARWFTDYEPGIHWPQMQMQSGVTGTNTMRIYDPVKQARDHDATGEFVGRYAGGGVGGPIVDHKVRTGAARAALTEVRRRLRAEGVLDEILAKHGSRRPASNRRR
jgi:deoxyribodipyrimidine photo-lyase